LDRFGSVLVLEPKQEISDRPLDVGEHGCSNHHTSSIPDGDDFHSKLEFDPDASREQLASIVQQRNSPWGLEKGYE
jgi:hypothetical protein